MTYMILYTSYDFIFQFILLESQTRKPLISEKTAI